jgi:hypothetical protein
MRGSFLKEALIKSFDRPVLSRVEGLRTNGKVLIPFVVSLSNALLSLSKGMNGIHLFRASLKRNGKPSPADRVGFLQYRRVSIPIAKK